MRATSLFCALVLPLFAWAGPLQPRWGHLQGVDQIRGGELTTVAGKPLGVRSFRVRKCPKVDNSLWIDTRDSLDEDWMFKHYNGILCQESNGEAMQNPPHTDKTWYLVGNVRYHSNVPDPIGYVYRPSVRLTDKNAKIPECDSLDLPRPDDRWCMCASVPYIPDVPGSPGIKCFEPGRKEALGMENYITHYTSA